MANGPSHRVQLPSLITATGQQVRERPQIAVQALQRKDDGVWIISFIGPSGVHWQALPEEAASVGRALTMAYDDYLRLR